VADNRVNVIFAVTKGQTERYSSLSDIIPGSVTGELDEDSSNIVDLVRENYEVSNEEEGKGEGGVSLLGFELKLYCCIEKYYRLPFLLPDRVIYK